MARRFFYVIFFNNQRIQALLDAMRFVANPVEKTPAHVTIRGPYPQRYNVCSLERKAREAKVLAEGAGAFFYEGQNTVFIRCRSERFREFWSKKDHGFNPHITIYDGPSREFAKILLDRLEHIPIRFNFFIDGLSVLESHKGQYSTWLRESYNEVLAKEVVGEPLTISEIDELPWERRFFLIESFARELANAGTHRHIELSKVADDELVDEVWRKAKKVRGKDPGKIRQDPYGNPIQRGLYGNDSSQGWEIDHIKPTNRGGSDHLRNLQAMQTAKNRELGDTLQKRSRHSKR